MVFRTPLSTYRLQFHAGFTLQQGRAIVPYLAELGISDVYSSPLLRARKGSTHGYDIVDPSNINPEVGNDDDFAELHGELDRRDMGLVLDIVPNHMAVSHENAWWMSVLENGRQSRFVHYFDIDWREEKVLLPILGRPYGEVLNEGEIQLGYDVDGLFFTYYDKRLPLAPQSYHLVLRQCIDALPNEGLAIEVHDLVDGAVANSRFLKETLWRLHEQAPPFREALDAAIARINKSADELDHLLAAQWYRLAYWRIASESINYRRFFDVTDLVGLCIENPEVFEIRNQRIVDWIGEGRVTGLRIDHIDGLHDPLSYLTKLQLRLGDPATDIAENFYVVVEKILAEGEALPPNFRVAGTTGYDFLDTANAVFVDPAGLAQLGESYVAFTGCTTPFHDLVYQRKKQVIHDLFSGEMRALGLHLGRLATAHRNARDFAPSELQTALLEITACMPVYRTYIREAPPGESDAAILRKAIDEARHRAAGSAEDAVFDFVAKVLLLEPPPYIEGERDKWLAFVMRWQQFTGRVMAKGVEDTAFYNYNRLISLNEVGGEPGRNGDFDPVAELHARNERIQRDWPHSMNATSTHDTKRSEDVRARISVLSEMPDVWMREARRWSKINAPLKRGPGPDANEELMIYQTLVGAWPLDERELPSLPDRLRLFLEKAAREAKTHSSWLDPIADYEKSLQDFVVALLEHQPFLDPFRRFQKRIAFHGYLNSLAQVVLKITSPGVPDFYQGSELWDFSLVDPDNRRPVDYDARRAALATLPTTPPPVLLRNWRDGRIKLFVTQRTLAVRARRKFDSYRAIEAGPNAVAWLRGDDTLIVLPRLTTQLGKDLPVGEEVWGDRSLAISGTWRNAYTGEGWEGETMPMSVALATFPVGVWERA